MKKILISSLCALFSLDGVSGMGGPRSNILWNFSVPVRPRADERLLAPIDGANVLASVEKAPEWAEVQLEAKLGEEVLLGKFELLIPQMGCFGEITEGRILVRKIVEQASSTGKFTERYEIQGFSPDEGEEFATLCNKGGKCTGKEIVNDIVLEKLEKSGKSENAALIRVSSILMGEKMKGILNGFGVEVFSTKGKWVNGGYSINVKVDAEPSSSGVVNFPVKEIGRIETFYGIAVFAQCSIKNKIHKKKSKTLESGKIYFFGRGTEMWRGIEPQYGPILSLLITEKKPLTGKDIGKRLKDAGITQSMVCERIKQMNPGLEKHGIEIKGSTKGYKIQALEYPEEREVIDGVWSRRHTSENGEMRYTLKKGNLEKEIELRLAMFLKFLGELTNPATWQEATKAVLPWDVRNSESMVVDKLSKWNDNIRPFGIDIGDEKRGYKIWEIEGKGEPAEEPSILHEKSKETAKGAGKKGGRRSKKALKEPVAEPSLLHAEPKETLEGPSSKRGRFDDKASQAHDNVYVELRPQAPNPGQDDRQSVNMLLENFGNGQPEPQGQQQDMALGNFGNTQPVPQMQQWNQAQIPFQQGPMMSQPYNQPQQYQNLVQNNVQITYGRQNFGNAQPVPQMQQWNQAQATFQQGPMMSQPYDQPQQYQNLVQNNVQIMYGQQNFGNAQPVPQMQQWNQAQATFQQGSMMSQPYDQLQQYQNQWQSNMQNQNMPLGNFGNIQFASQEQPISGAQYVNQGTMGVGNFF